MWEKADKLILVVKVIQRNEMMGCHRYRKPVFSLNSSPPPQCLMMPMPQALSMCKNMPAVLETPAMIE